MSDSEFNYMREGVVADLAELLVKNYGMSVAESLETLYNSETYAKLSNRNTGLYFQSTQYVYSFLQNELATGLIA